MNRLCRAISLFASIPLSLAFGETVILNLSDEGALDRLTAQGSEISLVSNAEGPALRVRTGTEHDWTGVTFNAGVDASAFAQLTFQLRNSGDAPVQVRCRIDSRPRGAKKADVISRTSNFSLPAGTGEEVSIPLIPHVDYPGVKREDFFGMRGIPFFNKDSMYLENLTEITFFLIQDQAEHVIELGNLRLEGKQAHETEALSLSGPVFPMIDEFGQFKHKDWPGKTHSLQELRQQRVAEADKLASSSAPASWNRYGGWKDGPQLESTGWFRTEKYKGKWHLVDPAGRLFFSLGIDGVMFKLGTIVTERQHWFENLPEDNAANSELYFSWKPGLERSDFYNKDCRAFSFHKYNAMRKYGEDWKAQFAATAIKRLPAWGINTLGNWSDSSIYLQGKLPYVAYVRPKSRSLEGSSGHWGKFKDVFDPEFEAQLRKQMNGKDLAGTWNDPMCIGYFVDNELVFGDDTSFAVATLISPADQKAKQVLIADLKTKYQTIDALNKAWETDHASWQSLLAHAEAPRGEGARPDLVNFYTKFVRTYFSTIRKVLKEIAPNHLYLGCRHGNSAPLNPIVYEMNSEYADVVSFNVYSRYLADKLPRLEGAGDKPYIIGEFHFGALDRGQFDTGLVSVSDQNERADAFTQFVRDCVDHPNIVGCHWFQYCDSPTTGRLWDHENFQIGFTDACDTPYAELIEASRKAGEALYE